MSIEKSIEYKAKSSAYVSIHMVEGFKLDIIFHISYFIFHISYFMLSACDNYTVSGLLFERRHALVN